MGMIETLEGRTFLSASPVTAVHVAVQHAIKPSIIMANTAMIGEYENMNGGQYMIGGDIGDVDLKITSVKRNRVFGSIEFDSQDGTVITAKINATLTRGNHLNVPMHSRGTSGTLTLIYLNYGVNGFGGAFKGTNFGGIKMRHVIGILSVINAEALNVQLPTLPDYGNDSSDSTIPTIPTLPSY